MPLLWWRVSARRQRSGLRMPCSVLCLYVSLRVCSKSVLCRGLMSKVLGPCQSCGNLVPMAARAFEARTNVSAMALRSHSSALLIRSHQPPAFLTIGCAQQDDGTAGLPSVRMTRLPDEGSSPQTASTRLYLTRHIFDPAERPHRACGRRSKGSF